MGLLGARLGLLGLDVVAAPRFPLTDAEVAGDYLDESDIDNQPDDVLFVMDALLASDGPMAGVVDPTRVAVAGHSDGGLTALSVAADAPEGMRAVVALSTSPVGRPGENPPLFVVQGDEDDINGWEYGEAVYDEATPPKFIVSLIGAGHLGPYPRGQRVGTGDPRCHAGIPRPLRRQPERRRLVCPRRRRARPRHGGGDPLRTEPSEGYLGTNTVIE